MNKKSLTLTILIIISLILIYILCTQLYTKTYYYYHNISLDDLRKNITIQMKDTHINTTQSLILDNVCRLENKTGMCYFNASIQALLANRPFTLFFVMNDFNAEQVACVIMQKIVHKILTNRYTSLLPEVDALAKLKSLSENFKRKGGDPSFCLPRLIDKLDEECLGIKLPGSPQSFYIKEDVDFFCMRCSNYNRNSEKYLVYDVTFGNNFSKSFICALNVMRYKAKNKMHKCKKCSQFDLRDHLSMKFNIAENIMFENGRLCRNHKSIDYVTGSMEIQKNIIIGKNLYELYAILCIHGSVNDCHVNTIAKKGDKWFLMDDINIREIKLENEKAVEKNSWMYLYRELID